jgi:predicted membrane channel-forming protein YqfA (hemolysin III family)
MLIPFFEVIFSVSLFAGFSASEFFHLVEQTKQKRGDA